MRESGHSSAPQLVRPLLLRSPISLSNELDDPLADDDEQELHDVGNQSASRHRYGATSSIADVLGIPLGPGLVHEKDETARKYGFAPTSTERAPFSSDEAFDSVVGPSVGQVIRADTDAARNEERSDRENAAFEFPVFLFEFLTHVFYPLSIPVVMAVQGVCAAQSKGFIPGTATFGIQALASALTIAPTVLAIVYRESEAWAAAPAAVGGTMALFRLLVIGGKYGCFPPWLYRRVLYGEVRVPDTLLLLAWSVKIQRAIVDDELLQAQQRSNIFLEEMYFVTSSGSRWNAQDYATSLCRFAFATPRFGFAFSSFTRACAVVLSLFPLWKFLSEAEDVRRAPAIALVVLMMMETLLFSTLVYGFMASGVLHYYRLGLMREAHVAVLSFSRDRASARRSSAARGVVSAQVAANLCTWVSLSTVLSGYALTFTRRMSFNCLAYVAVSTSLGGVLILQAWLTGTVDTKILCVVSYLFVTVCGGLVLTVFAAYRANNVEAVALKKLEEERLALCWRRHFGATTTSCPPQSLARRLCDPSGTPPIASGVAEVRTYSAMDFLANKASRDEAEDYLATIDATMAVLRQRRESTPLKVMFVAASAELVTAVLSLAASGALLILGVLIKSNPVSS